MHMGAAALRSTSPSSVVQDIAAREAHLLHLSSELLGVDKKFGKTLNSRMDVHSAIVAGALQYSALIVLISRFKALPEGDVVNVLGISTRTLRRQRETPKKAMPPDLASKTWLFAETLAKASEVFGGKEQAEAWMDRPAMGLDGQRPIEMLQTVQGAEIVNDFLTRLEYNVYS
jgi:putative toxin-antitoxin system antitoxin component (TIGR02293 family)